jgi:hypothetical protein
MLLRSDVLEPPTVVADSPAGVLAEQRDQASSKSPAETPLR